MPLPEIPEYERIVVRAWWCDREGFIAIGDSRARQERFCRGLQHSLGPQGCRMMLLTPEFIELYKGRVVGKLEEVM